MDYIKDIPTLTGDNYTEWKKKINLSFILAEVDWVVTSPCPTEPVTPERERQTSLMPLGQLKRGILNPKRCPMTLSIGSGSLPTRNIWL